MRLVEMDKVLTPEDKKLLGWPLPDDADIASQQIALLIAFDRADGDLEGPITQEYLIGDKGKGTSGMLKRGPYITESAVLPHT